jgi:hypothetical protein
VSAPVDLLLNRKAKYRGQVVTSGNKRAFLVGERTDQDSKAPPPDRRADVQRGSGAAGAG